MSVLERGSHTVVMLVNNPCTHDSRVVKTAETLQADGYLVTVIARMADGLKQSESINGVVYQRCSALPKDYKSVFAELNVIPTQLIRAERCSWRQLVLKAFVGLAIPLIYCCQSVITFWRASSDYAVQTFGKGASHVSKVLDNDFLSLIRIVRRIVAPGRSLLGRITTLFKRNMYQLIAADEYAAIVFELAVSLKPSVVHCHDLDTLSAGVLIANKLNVKLIYDSHELEMHRNTTYSKLVQLRRSWNESRGIRRADAVITVSESIADHLRDAYKIPRPVIVMNAPDFCEQAPPVTDLRKVIGLCDHIPLAVYVGAVTINRGLERVVGALKYYPELHFACVGPRRALTEKALRELAGQEGVANRLHWIDPVAPRDVVGFVSTASVSVLLIQNVCLSYYYCMPNKLFESVFSRLPVVVSNLKDMRQFVERFHCGVVVDETNPVAIADTIRLVIARREDYFVSNESRRQIEREFGWQAQALKLKNLYAVLLHSAP